MTPRAADDRLLEAIVGWTAVVAGILVWLPLVRGATQGSAYRWALTRGIGGRGIDGQYGWLLLAGAFVFWLLALGWRGGRPPFRWLLLLFHVPLAAAVGYGAWRRPGDLRFQGATAGIDVSLRWVAPVLCAGFALAAVVWAWRDPRRPRREPVPWTWTRATRVRLILVLALLPLEAILFRSGGLQGPGNVIGAALVFWQWVMINRVLASARPIEGKATSDGP
jgi:hypothetical protein